MKPSQALKFIAGLGLTLSLCGIGFASETLVTSLSEGACWLEQGDHLKVVSFNDHEAFSTPREALEEVIHELLDKKAREDMDLMLHCGGQGVSIVARTNDTCAWFKLSQGKLVPRSIGGLEDAKRNGLCDGFKRGELIIGVNHEDESQLVQIHPAMESLTRVTLKVYKVVLKKEYMGQEFELLKEIKKRSSLVRYVELNQYQHPVGEFIQLK